MTHRGPVSADGRINKLLRLCEEENYPITRDEAQKRLISANICVETALAAVLIQRQAERNLTAQCAAEKIDASTRCIKDAILRHGSRPGAFAHVKLVSEKAHALSAVLGECPSLQCIIEDCVVSHPFADADLLGRHIIDTNVELIRKLVHDGTISSSILSL